MHEKAEHGPWKSEILQEADRVGVLKDGRLVECGTHEQLMKKTNGAYRALVETQLQA